MIQGPDEVDRYLVRIKGCKVWVSFHSMIAKGRGLRAKTERDVGILHLND